MIIVSIMDVTDQMGGTTKSWHVAPLTAALLCAQLGAPQIEQIFTREQVMAAQDIAESMPTLINPS